MPAGKSNGGATAPGVTAKEVTIVAYIAERPDERDGRCAGTEEPGNRWQGEVADTITDFQKVYDYAQKQLGTYQLWGRTPKFELVTAERSR